MKKLNINQEKIKKVLKGGFALATSSLVLVSFSGCNEQSVPRDYPSEYEYIDQSNNSFDSLYKTIIRDGKPIKAYRKDNISITINKDNFEIKEYLYLEDMISANIYDLETGYLIVELGLYDNFGSKRKDIKNWGIISENTYIADFKDLEAFVEGENSQDFYTIEEIRELEPKIVESVKMILEYENGNQKVK